MSIKSPKCSGLHTRTINVPNCIAGQPCKRIYHIYLPRVLCHGGARRLNASDGVDDGNTYDPTNNHVDASPEMLEEDIDIAYNHNHNQSHRRQNEEEYFKGHYYKVGTLPLVFGLHGYKSDPLSMMNFVSLADTFNFVLVLPEGLENSFNAGDCCGYALENKIDDVGFLSLIQSSMVAEFYFLHPSFSFGIGHNNGAFLLTYALEQNPHMFRAIVPISGYTHQVDEIRNGLGVGTGIGMMMHHSLDDQVIRPSGCCDNSHLPQCSGDVLSNYCMSVLQIFDLWAKQINMCENDDDVTNDGFGSAIVGGSDGLEYSLSYESQSQSTVFLLQPDTSDPQEIDPLFVSNLHTSVSYSGPNDEVICLTASSSSCVANSTLCVHTEQGDFKGNEEFFMFNEVMEFIAREACSVNDGMSEVIPGNDAKGKKAKHVCACLVSGQSDVEVEFGGVFCMDPLNKDGTFQALSSPQMPEAPSAVSTSAVSTVSTSTVSTVLPSTASSTTSTTTEQQSEEISDSIQEENPTQDLPSFSITETSSSPAATEDTDIFLNQNEQIDKVIPLASNATEFSSPVATEATKEKHESSYTIFPSAFDHSNKESPVSTASVMEQNGMLHAASSHLEMSGPTITESHTHKNPYVHVIWVSILLAVLMVLGAVYRRRRMHKKKLAIKHATRYQDSIEFDHSGSRGSPYRDFFRKGNGVSANNRDYDSEVGSEVEEHYPQYRYDGGGETELANRYEKPDVSPGSLDSSEWDEHRSPYRYAPSMRRDFAKQHIFDDYSFSDGTESFHDNASRKSSQALPDSHLNVINTPAMYLDTADRRMLRRYREKNKSTEPDSNSAISGRKPDPDEGELGSIRNSFQAKDNLDVLDEDLEKIEAEIL